MNDRDYDNWKLASPDYYDDNYPEVFETEFYKKFSCDEDLIAEFDDLIDKAKKDANIYLGNKDWDLFSLDDYVEMLLDEDKFFNLHDDEYGAIERAENDYTDAKEYAQEQKYQQMKDDKLTEGK